MKDQSLFYNIETSLTAYNAHVTNIVALRNQLILNQGMIPASEYKIMRELCDKILEVDKAHWNSIQAQAIQTGLDNGLSEDEALTNTLN